MEKLNSKKYQYMQIGIASPEEIMEWAHHIGPNGEDFYGEVKNPETLNYRSLKPEPEGLFCERIFGPVKDNTCYCGKAKKGEKICPHCGVEITGSKVRRERMGFIKLACPVVHTWYYKNSPSKIAILLDMKTKDIEDVVNYATYVVTKVDPALQERLDEYNSQLEEDEPHVNIQLFQLVSEQENAKLKRAFGPYFKSMSGAEAIKTLLHELDLDETISQLREELVKCSKNDREKLTKRLDLCEAFANSDNKPEWMVMDIIPVIPPDLRPIVLREDGRPTTTGLNDLYKNIISRNNLLKEQMAQRAPELMLKNQKRMLQQAVDCLIDNAKVNKRAGKDKSKVVKSLSDNLRGKQGRFRQNLLGKRVDYSGRSVIIIGPDLKMYQCGIPRKMALILFKPFIMNYMRKKEDEINKKNEAMGLPIKSEKANLRKLKEMIETGTPEAMEALEHVIVEHPVLLNRAPTLHRLSIQAFEPKLVEGKAIRLHPLVCTAFNADFDGDQMPVHVPLSQEAQAEARMLMLASKNILAPKDGRPIVTPSQDMIIGNYYLTIEEHDPREGMAFKDINEIEHAYEEGLIGLHTRIVIPARNCGKNLINLHNASEEELDARVQLNEEYKNKYLITTYGKTIFNTIFPEFFPYVNAPDAKNLTYGVDSKYLVDKGQNYVEAIHNLPLESPVKKKFLETIIAEVFAQSKLAETSNTLDKMKDIGFYYSTRCGLTVSAFDVETVQGKEDILKAADEKVKKYRRLYERGMFKDEERYKKVLGVWDEAKDQILAKIKVMKAEKASTNHIFLMADSGARGNESNFMQLAGFRGLMAKPNGESMEIPVRSCFIEGMSMSEFFISTHGARKGSTDTALKTAESGYLTRRLVDVSQDVIVTCDDCGTDKGLYVNDIYPDKAGVIDKSGDPIVPLKERITGRYSAEKITYLDNSGNEVVVVDRNEFIDDKVAAKIIQYRDKIYGKDNPKFPGIKIRTLLTCNAPNLTGGEHGCGTPNGVCVKCYGSDLSTNLPVEKGEVVGIIAAQSIGEPGTQLTMRTFHSGGVAGDDITQGLPRIQELFEAREPKAKAIISKFKGKVSKISHDEKDNRYTITVTSEKGDYSLDYTTDSGRSKVVEVGQKVNPGDQISDGLINPKELVKYAPTESVEAYILKEVEKVYRAQSVNISDKHVEIIIKQMLQKVQVIYPGSTNLIPGSYISKSEIYKIIKDCYNNHKEIPVVKPILLGITRSSLKADSFLSAASFQETTRVLTEAAIRGKRDTLEGLKENIIVGGLIPAGTGLVDEVDVEVNDVNSKYSLTDI